MTVSADFLVIGAGIAGTSAAWFLAPHGRVIVLERESYPGYHTTGRSAAMFMESYGTPQVRALTCASRAFFERPPEGFCAHAVLAPRGVMLVGTAAQAELLEEAWTTARARSTDAELLSCAQAMARVPVLEPSFVAGAVLDEQALDIDVNEIHQGFLRGIRAHNGQIVCDAVVTRIERLAGEWEIEAGAQRYRAPVVLNAAGAWCDLVAGLGGARPIGLQPRRRTAFIFTPPQGQATARWPAVVGVDESFYFKPEAGMLLGSPANTDPVEPQDVQAEEYDVALGIERIQAATSLRIRRPTRVWAGLRSFVADGDLVAGYDALCPGLFWVAAQGGYGIQTCAAMGEASAALVRGLPLPQRIQDYGLTAAMLSPSRSTLRD